MYIPPAFKDTELKSIHEIIRNARLANSNRAGVVAGLSESERESDRVVATMIPL